MLCVKPIFWNPKMLVCTLGGEGYEKVYCLYFRNVQEMCTRDPKWLPHKTVPKTSFFIKITISQYHDIDISYIDIDIAKNAFSMTSLVVPLSIDPFQKAILSSSRCKLAILFSCQCWESNLDGIYQHIRFFPKAWFYQRVQVHVWSKYLGLNLKMTPKVLYQSLDPKMWIHLNRFLTPICNTKMWGVNFVLNHLFRIQPHSDIWIIIPRWRL